MARKITDYNGQVTAPNSDYPDGRIKDSTGLNDGTVYDEKAYGDIQQFFMKLLRQAEITANGNPENETNGFQFMAALFKLVKPFGVRIDFDRSTSAVFDTKFNTVIFITPSAPNSGNFSIGDSPENDDLTMIAVINKSAFSVTVYPSSYHSDTIEGGASTTVDAGKVKTFILDKPAANWVLYSYV